MDRVLAKSRRILLQSELLSAGFSFQGIVVIAGLLADEENGFGFLFTLGHAGARISVGRFGLGCCEDDYCRAATVSTSRNQQSVACVSGIPPPARQAQSTGLFSQNQQSSGVSPALLTNSLLKGIQQQIRDNLGCILGAVSRTLHRVGAFQGTAQIKR